MQKQDANYLWYLGQKIRFARKQIGLNQTELASRVGMTQQLISLSENGKYTLRIDQLRKIADVCDVPLASLVREDEEGNQLAKFFDQLDPTALQCTIDQLSRLLQLKVEHNN